MKNFTQLPKNLVDKSRLSKQLLLITVLCFAFSVKAQVRLVKDIHTNGHSEPSSFYEYNGRLFFSAKDASSSVRFIYVTDGTSAGTDKIRLDSNSGAFLSNNFGSVGFREHNSELYFDAVETNTSSVYKLNGNNNFAFHVFNITTLSQQVSRFIDSAIMNDKIVFTPFNASTASDGVEPYVIDLSNSANNGVLLDIYSGTGNSNPRYFTVINNNMIFACGNTTNGRELWKTDGTTGGTTLFQDINAGVGDSNPNQFNVIGSQLTFAATHDVLGRELFKTNGNTGSLVLIKNIHPSGDSNPTSITNIGDTLYFSADNGSVGNELWKSNGNNSGTVLIKDISPSGDSNPSMFTQVGSDIFFTVENNGISNVELWKTDGTTAGTTFIKDFPEAGVGNAHISNLTEYNGKLYFVASSNDNSLIIDGLWVSDGTNAGTVFIETNVGSPVKTVKNLNVYNNELYFQGLIDPYGFELMAFFDASLGVNDYELSAETVSLFPNPSNNYFEIESNQTLTKVEIYSLQGQSIKSFVPQNQYDISELSSGIYFVKIQASNSEITKRIIKE